MTDPIIAGYAATLGSELTLHVLNFLGQRLRTALFGTPRQEAVQRCYQAATATLLPDDDADSEAYHPILQTLFEQPAVQAELAKLAKGRLPDQAELVERFEETCNSQTHLPPYDFPERLAAAVEAFFDTASTEPELVNTVIAGQSRHLVEDVRAIRQAMEQTNKTTIPIPPQISPALKRAVKALDSEFQETRQSNVKTIASSNDPLAPKILMLAIEHHSFYDVRTNSLQQLQWHFDTPEMIPTLIMALDDDEWDLWEMAYEKLAQFGQSAIPKLLEALSHHPKPKVRYGAAAALEQIGDHTVVPELIRALGDENADVRCRAATSLGEMKAVDAIPTLAELLSDTEKSEWIQERVCDVADIALQNIGTPEALAVRNR